MSVEHLPQIIVLYGPPAAGKGTQAHFLKELLTDRYHLDFGSELRSFVSQHLGQYSNKNETLGADSDPEKVAVARRLKADMQAFLPVQTADLRYVIEQSITDCVSRGQGMIIEGPGRLVEEAQWLSGFMAQTGVTVGIYHLYVSLEEVLARSSTRYYLPSSKKPFVSLEAAQKEATDGEIPYRRPEDEDREGIKQRYRMLYSDNFAKIISIYQLQAKAQVFTLDASKPIPEVSQDIKNYMKVFFGAEF